MKRIGDVAKTEIFVDVQCEECNKTFKRNQNRYDTCLKNKSKMFCSRNCRDKYRTDYIKLHGIEQYKKGLKQWIEKFGRPSRWNELSPFRNYMYRLNNKNKYQKPNIDITAEYLKELYDEQDGLCKLSKIPMLLARSGWKRDIKHPYKASLDRIDHTLPYQIGNVRFICMIANYARNNFTDEQVIEFCLNLAKNYDNRLPESS